MGIRVAVAGASGYAGGELLRLLAGHPEFELVAATRPRQRRGSPVAAVHPHLLGLDLTFGATDAGDARPTPTWSSWRCRTASRRRSPPQLPADVKVVDLGADHRLRDADAWAALLRRRRTPAPGPTACPSCPASGRAIAGVDPGRGTGCYAVAITLALAPLIAAGLAEPGRRGGGRRVGHHRRRPGAQAAPARQRGDGRPVALQGRRAPARAGDQAGHRRARRCRSRRCWRRCRAASWPPSPRGRPGRASPRPTCAAVLRRRTTASRSCTVLPEGALAAHRRHARLQRLPPAGRRSTSTPAGSSCVSAIDNLGKGAAGQAVQCANLMLGLPETAGLTRGTE